jgi:hypothetical protein
VQCVDEFLPADDASHGHDRMPDVVMGPPVGGGTMGSMDVVSLGCGGQITLYLGEHAVVDGPGPDLLVFENAFPVGTETFAEPGEVRVSDDGETWVSFGCDAGGTWPPTGCAGIEPVYATPDNGLATDPTQAGGDAFDLADVGLPSASYVRIIDRTDAYYGDRMWCGAAGGFDLDAAAVVGVAP